MRLRDIGEFAFIERISHFTRCERRDVLVSIGDDCAVVETHSGDRLAVTTDAMVEGRHFRLDWLTSYQIGARAMTACLSDIAAMGAEPCFAFSSVALPPECEVQVAEGLVRGLVDQAERYGACLVGGDTVAAPAEIMLDVMLVGRCRKHIWQRDGARVGDLVVWRQLFFPSSDNYLCRFSAGWDRLFSPLSHVFSLIGSRLSFLAVTRGCLWPCCRTRGTYVNVVTLV